MLRNEREWLCSAFVVLDDKLNFEAVMNDSAIYFGRINTWLTPCPNCDSRSKFSGRDSIWAIEALFKILLW